MSASLLTGNLAAHWIQSGFLAVAALATLRVLQPREPKVRLALLQLILVSIVALPLMQPWQPHPLMVATPQTLGAVDSNAVVSAGSIAVDEAGPAGWFQPVGIVMMIFAGIAVRLLWLVYGIVRLAQFSRAARERGRPLVADELESQIGVSARYIEQRPGLGPCTFGFLRSTVALPAGFDALARSFQRAIVGHELVHVKRRDIAVAFAEELAVAMLWFHPWVWLLRARIRVAREQVVDRSVVEILGDRGEYVRCLVEIAGHDLVPHLSQAGAGMLLPRELHARVDAIFKEVGMSRRRLATITIAFLSVIAATGWVTASTVPLRVPNVVSGASRAQTVQNVPPDTPRRQTKMGFAEYPLEALEKGIRGTVRVAITVSPAGQVTTASVVSGPQELRASAFKVAMGLEFAPAVGTTAMTVAVEYVLTTNYWGVRIGDLSSVVSSPPARGAAPPGVGPDASGAYRIGGAIRPPRKIADVPPLYPEAAQREKVEGVVIIETRVDEAGNVGDTRLLRSIPMLDQAAIDAVRQWKYEPTLMNGQPVPVIMTVTVNFTLRDSAPGAVVRLDVNVPPELQRTPGSVRLVVRANDMGVLLTNDNQAFAFVPLITDQPVSDRVRVGIYRMNPEAGSTPQLLGTVDTETRAVVQSPTIPSFGIQLVNVETR